MALPRGAAIRRCRRGGLPAALVLAASLALVPAARADAKPDVTALAVQAIRIEATPLVAFQAGEPERKRFGKLVWRGGVQLTSPSPYLGGLSGLVLAPDGERFLAVSDAGLWLAGRLTYRGQSPAGVAEARVGPVLGLKGRRLAREADRDAEGLALAEGDLEAGKLLMCFEQNRRIARVAVGPGGLSGAEVLLPLPPEVRSLSSNKSLESVAVIAAGPLQGRVVAFAERKRDGAGQIGWLLDGAKAEPLRLANPRGYDVTDLAALPDGGLIVLERAFSWSEGIRFRIERLAPEQIVPGETMTGEVLFEGDQTYNVDNMEGVAVSQGRRGETVLTLVSDDNFSIIQRTILLQFAIEPP